MNTTEASEAAPVEAGSVAPRLAAALDRVWATIRHRHSEVPEVVITLGSGSIGARADRLTLGHFAANRWQRGEGRLPEMFVAGEGLAAGPRDVLGTLLHEAAHGLADARGVQDTSRQGRYHNARYRALATELGLEISKVEGIGWSGTHVPDTTATTYAAELADLAGAIVAFRHTEHSPALTGTDDDSGDGQRGRGNGLAARCECGRRIRIAPTVYATGPITCGYAAVTSPATTPTPKRRKERVDTYASTRRILTAPRRKPARSRACPSRSTVRPWHPRGGLGGATRGGFQLRPGATPPWHPAVAPRRGTRVAPPRGRPVAPRARTTPRPRTHARTRITHARPHARSLRRARAAHAQPYTHPRARACAHARTPTRRRTQAPPPGRGTSVNALCAASGRMNE